MIKHLRPRSKFEIFKINLKNGIKKYKYFIPIIGYAWFIINVVRINKIKQKEYNIMYCYSGESGLQYIYAFYCLIVHGSSLFGLLFFIFVL